jgi:hypothetical protein
LLKRLFRAIVSQKDFFLQIAVAWAPHIDNSRHEIERDDCKDDTKTRADASDQQLFPARTTHGFDCSRARTESSFRYGSSRLRQLSIEPFAQHGCTTSPHPGF